MATITKENIGQLHEKITVTLDKGDYIPSFEKTLKDYSKKANIPGFRPGKVPSGMIKKMYGPSLFMDEVLRSVDKELQSYLEKEKIDIFAQPLPADTQDLDKLDVNNPSEYNFDFEIGVKPDFQLPELDKLPITAYNIDITDEMVNKEIERLQNRYGNVVDKDVVDGEENILNVVFTELDEAGNEVEGGITKDNSILVKYFAEAVRSQLMGKKANDSIQIRLGDAFEDKELSFIAEDLGLAKDDESAKQKNFKILITKIGELEKRELNEDFYKQLYPQDEVKTEEDFRKKVYDDIYMYWATQSRNQIHDQLFHALSEHTHIDFPEGFLRKWLITQNNQPAQDGQEKQIKSEEDIDKDMPDFINQLTWTLISDKIIKGNDIQVTPEEIKNFARQQLFGYMGGNAADMESQPWVNDYVDRMMNDRKFVEDAYTRIQSQKVFEWAETQIKPVSQQISADEFEKMVNEHHHHHHH